jgi:hypothetical protein
MYILMPITALYFLIMGVLLGALLTDSRYKQLAQENGKSVPFVLLFVTLFWPLSVPFLIIAINRYEKKEKKMSENPLDYNF